MKIYIDPEREKVLLLCLQFDTQQARYFSPHERFSINQERAKIMQENYEYQQPLYIENKITKIIITINQTHWEPKEF